MKRQTDRETDREAGTGSTRQTCCEGCTTAQRGMQMDCEHHGKWEAEEEEALLQRTATAM